MSDRDKFEHDIFLSYNRADEEWTRALATRLEKEKHGNRFLKVFFAPWDITPGQPFIRKIEEALEKSLKVGLVMSPESLASEWVELEKLGAFYLSIKTRNDLLIPIYLKDCEPPTFLAQLSYVDFRDASNYEESYRILLAAIKGEKPPRGSGNGPTATLRVPIPEPSVEFVARKDEHGKDMVGKIIDAVTQRQNGLIALFGDGGRGKTVLAAETVRALDKTYRIVWTSADGREDFSISTLLDDIASQLGAPELRKEALDAKKEALQAIISAGLTLIVLDNFETVSDAEQRNCVSWLSKSAPCPSLITTRQRIPAASNIRVEEMTDDEARIFIERLIEQTNDPDTFKGLDLDSISKEAEYNPLIIGWIIGQIDLAQSYAEVLSDLSKGEGDAAERVFDRSFELEQLTDDGRDALLTLSLFTPSASRIALAAVAGFGGDADRLNKALSRLAALRLVKSLDQGNRLAVEGLTRNFAAARLSKDARADEFRHRFTQYFLSYSEEHKEHNPENHNVLESEKDNLLSAIDVAFSQQDWLTVMRLVEIVGWQLSGVLYVRGYWNEAARCGEQALKSARELKSEPGIAIFAHNLAIACQQRGDLGEARKLYNESLEIKKKLGDQIGIASTQHQLAVLAQAQGELDEARKLYDESLEIKKKLGNLSGIAGTLHQLAVLAQAQGEMDEARKLYNESLEIAKKLDNQIGIANTLHQLAMLAQDQGELDDARKLYDESLEINKKLGNLSGIASTQHQLAVLAQAQGELDEARKLYDESLEIKKKLGDQIGIANTLHQLAVLAQAQGELNDARKLYGESLEINKKLDNQSGIASTIHNLAAIAQAQGELDEARKLYDESLEIAKKLGDQSGIANTLHQLAVLAQAQGELDEARKLYDESLEIKKKLGDQIGIANTLHQLGRLAQAQGDLDEAHKLYDASLGINKKLGNQYGIAVTLGQMGLLAEYEGNKEEAARLYNDALVIFEKLRSPYAKVARRLLERVTD